MLWIGVFVRSTVGSLIPSLWGAGIFSFSSILFGAVGAFLGIWIGYRLSRW